MRKRNRLVPLSLALCILLATAACSTNGSPAGGPSSGTPNTTTTSSKPAKSKPTSVPTITLAFCQSILTIAEANQIMKPATPATTIRVDSTSTGGSCSYEYATFRSVVTVTFLPYTGGAANAQATLAGAAAQLSRVNGAQVTTTQVTGVGDAALFVTATITSLSIKEAAIDTIDGAVLLSCANFKVGASSFATQQTALTQVCQQVISRL